MVQLVDVNHPDKEERAIDVSIWIFTRRLQCSFSWIRISKMESVSDIVEWYRGKSVLITGATGFMGKVLVEKLLRSCPDIGTIFLLTRGTTRTSARDRVHKMLKLSLFDELRDSRINLQEKLVAVCGDIILPNMGLSDEDRHLLQHSVSVVFHVAATVRFNDHLRYFVAINCEGTEAVLQFCEGIINLRAIVYVSTAFTNCHLSVIQERIYPPPVDIDKIKHCMAGLDDDLLEFITPRLIDKHPNAYTFTKALAEHIVAAYSNKLPIVIVRPSIVTASWKEPKPGWVDSYGGPVFYIINIVKGLLKSVYGRKEAVADMIPVDLCINLMIAAAWDIGNREAPKLVPDVLIYNCVSGALNPLTWGLFIDEIGKCSATYSKSGAHTKSTVTLTDSRIKHKLTNFFNHVLPATLMDCFAYISGGKPRFRYYASKIIEIVSATEYFTLREWKIEANNVTLLKNRMSNIDTEIFDFDVTKIDWKEYINSYVSGIKENLMQRKSNAVNATEQPIAGNELMKKSVYFVILGIIVICVVSFCTVRRLEEYLVY